MADETQVPVPSSPSTAQQEHVSQHGESQAPSPGVSRQESPASSGETSAPSPGAKGETRETLLEAVTKAVPELRTGDRGDREPSGAPLAPGTKSEPPSQQPQPGADELPDEVAQEEYAQLSPRTQRRIKQLVEQRRAARSEVDQLRSTLGPGAEAAHQVSKYLQDNDIAREDFLLTLELAAAMRRGDFRTFYAGVKPYMDLAEQYLGVQLPPDLQQVVQQGQMSPQAAALYHRERMDRALSDTQRLRQAQTIDMRDSAAAQQQLRNAVANSVNAWETSIVQSDPDYGLKKAAVSDAMWSVIHERGNPQSPEQAVAIAQEAYARVNRHYQNWGPPPKRATMRQPSSTGRFNGASPEPRNLHEAVEQAIDRARAL